jgi:predicted secreted protein
MGLVTFLATYVMVWWLLFFVALPWGNRAPGTASLGFNPGFNQGVDQGFDQGVDPGLDPGLDPGAPERPQLWLKVGIVSLVTALICLGFHFTAELWMPPLREWLQHD